MRLKDDTVDISELRPEMRAALEIIEEEHRDISELEMVITSGHEDVAHSVARSKHHSRDAVDLRSRYYSDSEMLRFIENCERRIGKWFLFLIENDHIHVHFAPVQGAGNLWEAIHPYPDTVELEPCSG